MTFDIRYSTFAIPTHLRAPVLFARSLTVAVLMLWWAGPTLRTASAQSGGGYVIKKSTIDSGGGTVSGGDYRLTGTVGQHDAAPLSGGDYSLTGGFWSPAAPAPAAPAPDPSGIDKPRFVSFSVPASATAAVGETALRLNLNSMHRVDPPYTAQPGAPAFTLCEGKDRWAGPPSVFVESQSAGTRFIAAQTQTTAYYRDWTAFKSCTDTFPPFEYGVHFNSSMKLKLCAVDGDCVVGRCRIGAGAPSNFACYADADCPVGTGTCQDIVQAGETCTVTVDPLIHLTGSVVVPSSEYTVDNVAAVCAGNEGSAACQAGGANASAGLPMATQRWGDVVASFQQSCAELLAGTPPPGCNAGNCSSITPPVLCTTQPDAQDFGSLVNKFKSLVGAPIKARALLAGDSAGVISLSADLGFTHVSAGVDAFKGTAFPYTPECLTNP